MKVAIVGSGISGVTTAYFLAKAGHDVTIYDKDRYPAMETSYANGGQLSASNAEVWNNWHNVFKAIKWLAKPDAPLLFNPKPSWDKYSWMFRFMTHIKDAEANTYNTCQLAIQAHKLYLDISVEESVKFDMVRKGIMHFYREDSSLEQAIKTNRLYNFAGLHREYKTADELKAIEPTLNVDGVVGGFHCPDDYTGDIHKFTYNLYNKLHSKYNVDYVRAEVKDLNTLTKDYDRVVVCAGVYSKHLAKTVGDNLPVYPVKGYSVTITDPGEGTPWVSMLDDETKIVASRLGKDRYRIAGTAEFNGYNKDIKWNRIKPLMDWAELNFPDMEIEKYNPWAGLRPMMPNMMPVVKQSDKHSKVFYNTGHGHLGWTLSAITAKQLAEMF